MADYFGSCIFPKLVILSSDLPNQIWGTVRRAVNGNVVTVYYSCASSSEEGSEIVQPVELEWAFERLPSTKLRLLRWLCSTGDSYGFSLDSIVGTGCGNVDGASVTGVVHFSGQKVALKNVRGTRNDMWNGTLKLLVSSAKVNY